MNEKNIVLVGVGGQGLITLGRVIGNTAVNKGIKALTSETHGMAQRGGSVTVHVRLGEINSPIVARGYADAILGLELLETLRNIDYANEKTILIINKRIIRPQIPKVKLPKISEMLHVIDQINLKYKVIEALKLAIKAGSEITENIVMLGALMNTKILDDFITLADIEKTIEDMFPPSTAKTNLRALELGYNS